MNSIYDVEYASLCEIGFKCATSVRNRVAIRKIGYDCGHRCHQYQFASKNR